MRSLRIEDRMSERTGKLDVPYLLDLRDSRHVSIATRRDKSSISSVVMTSIERLLIAGSSFAWKE